jgi:hypothetical protein
VNPVRKRAARLAIYLECVGVVAIIRGSGYRECCDSLNEQYKNSRSRGSSARASRRPPTNPGAGSRVSGASSHSSAETCRAEEQSAKAPAAARRLPAKMRSWPPETPSCPKCRIAHGMPQRSWPACNLTEQGRPQQNDHASTFTLAHSAQFSGTSGAGANAWENPRQPVNLMTAL